MSTAMDTRVTGRQYERGGALAEFEEIYRSNVGVVKTYFARRCWEPQEVADLTSETIARDSDLRPAEDRPLERQTLRGTHFRRRHPLLSAAARAGFHPTLHASRLAAAAAIFRRLVAVSSQELELLPPS